MSGLLDEMRAACFAVTHAHLRRLVALGVGYPTLAELGRHHYGFGVVTASEDGRGLYVPDPDGELHLVLPVYEDGGLVDLVAFRSATPDKWLLRTGLGWALGLEWDLSGHDWAEPVRLDATPLDWLRAGAGGLCVLDWEAPELCDLANLSAVHCPDATIAGLLRNALTKPPRLPDISVGEIPLAA